MNIINIINEKGAQNGCLFDTGRLRRASALIIGAGGLGCGIAVHLAGAGVGGIGICDFDRVSESNLNRQFLYNAGDIGREKAATAARFLEKYAPDCRVAEISMKLSAGNAEEMIDGYDLAVLACDNIETRLAANNACVRRARALVDSGISGACGRVYLYIPGETACLNCLMDGKNESADKRTVSAAAGTVGGIAAMTALKYLSGDIGAKGGELIVIDTANNTIDNLPVKRSGECKTCGGDSYER